ncbi:50S ribosomal protein L25 [Candidatus Photodesmus blepharus]|nr:50S ribosomal protein L25 [Candidatus Photodesmus blepharus]
MKFEAIVRTELGKGASRRLRRAGRFPAIVYGNQAVPISIALIHNEVMNQIDKPSFYEGRITLMISSEEIKVKLQDIQRHAFRLQIEHIDFVRI